MVESQFKVNFIASGQVWRHYKHGHKYTVLAVSHNERTTMQSVVYVSHQDNRIWDRPLAEWMDIVQNEDGQQVQRYELVLDEFGLKLPVFQNNSAQGADQNLKDLDRLYRLKLHKIRNGQIPEDAITDQIDALRIKSGLTHGWAPGAEKENDNGAEGRQSE